MLNENDLFISKNIISTKSEYNYVEVEVFDGVVGGRFGYIFFDTFQAINFKYNDLFSLSIKFIYIFC